MYETGDRTPNVVEALRIAQVPGITVEFLFAIEGKQDCGYMMVWFHSILISPAFYYLYFP